MLCKRRNIKGRFERALRLEKAAKWFFHLTWDDNKNLIESGKRDIFMFRTLVLSLTFNCILGVPPSLLQDFFVRDIGKLYAYDFLPTLLKFYWLTLKTIHGSSFSRELSRDLFSTGGKRKFAIFEVFRAYLREFSIFFHEIFMVERYYRVLAADIKISIVNALLSLETRLKIPILVLFCRLFGIFADFCPFRHKPLT